jgi:hypothetical protein
MIMKNCPNCFRTNDDEAEYCQNCGTNFEAEEANQGDPKFNEPMSASQKCGYWFGAWVIVIVASVAVTATPACVLAVPYFPNGLFVCVSERLKPASSERIKTGHFEGERLIAEASSDGEQLRDESTQNEPATVHHYLVAARVVLPADRAGTATAPGDGFQICPAT